MKRRTFLAAMISAPAFAGLIAACGGDDDENDPGATPPYDLPQGADDVVLRVAYEGGYVAVETLFVALPTLLITGGGRVFTVAAIPEIYPGPLVTPLMVGTISPAGLQALMAAADEARLIGFVADYEIPAGMGISDAPDTAVTLTVNGNTYTHRAYALGFDGSQTPTRDRLDSFVTAVGDLATLVGASELTDPEEYVPERYRFRAMVTDPAQWNDLEPTIVEWPTESGLALSAGAECAVLDAATIGGLFTEARQNTLFQEGDTVYQLAVAAVLPGDAVCAVA